MRVDTAWNGNLYMNQVPCIFCVMHAYCMWACGSRCPWMASGRTRPATRIQPDPSLASAPQLCRNHRSSILEEPRSKNSVKASVQFKGQTVFLLQRLCCRARLRWSLKSENWICSDPFTDGPSSSSLSISKSGTDRPDSSSSFSPQLLA